MAANTDRTQAVLLQTLQQNGIADVAKAWIRAAVAKDLIAKSDPKLSKCQPPRDADEEVCDFVVAEHMKCRRMVYSASVLAAECPHVTTEGTTQHVQSLRRSLSESIQSMTSNENANNDSALLLLLRSWRSASATQKASLRQPEPSAALAIVQPDGAVERLDSKLADIEERHDTLRQLTRDSDALHGPSLSSRLAAAREEGFGHGQLALQHAVREAAAEASARVRAEERQRFDALLAQYQAEGRASQASALASLSEGLQREESSLARARDAAMAASASLQEQAVRDVEGAAAREAAVRRAAALESRALTLERERHEDEERRLHERCSSAEERARHAEVHARVQLERWKGEWLLGVAARETALARAEASLSAARAVFEEECKGQSASLGKVPGLTAECEALRAEVGRLRDELAAGGRREADTAAELARQRTAVADLSAKCATLEARVHGAEESAAEARAQCAASQTAAAGSKEEWATAVRMLRDRLAAAAAKIRAQEDALRRVEGEWSEKVAAAVSAERAVCASKEGAWASERAGLARQVDRLHEELQVERVRADEAHASLVGERSRCSELVRSLAEARGHSQAAAQALPPHHSPSLNSSVHNTSAFGLHHLHLPVSVTGAASGGRTPTASGMTQGQAALAASQAALARAAEVLGTDMLVPTAVLNTSSGGLNSSFGSGLATPTGTGTLPAPASHALYAGMAQAAGSGPSSLQNTPGRPPLPSSSGSSQS